MAYGPKAYWSLFRLEHESWIFVRIFHFIASYGDMSKDAPFHKGRQESKGKRKNSWTQTLYLWVLRLVGLQTIWNETMAALFGLNPIVALRNSEKFLHHQNSIVAGKRQKDSRTLLPVDETVEPSL